MIRVGIVGTGNIVGISHYHTVSLLKDGRAEVTAVYDTRMDGAAQWVKEHNINAKVCSSYDELLSCVDAVNICVPNRFHFEYAEKAIKANKHFLVEKPMALSLEECKALYEMCKDYKPVNMVGFVYRFSSVVCAAKKVIDERIGNIYTFSAWYGGKRIADPHVPKEWRMTRSLSGSGALGDFGSHLVDLADYLAGQRYSKVSCMEETFIKKRIWTDNTMQDVENDDSAVFTAKSTNGLGSFTVSRVGMDDIMILVTGEGGMLQISLRGEGEITYWEKESGGAYTGKIEDISFAKQKPFDGYFDNEMKAYLDAIEGKNSSYPNVAQGYYVEKVLHIADLSASNGQTEEIDL